MANDAFALSPISARATQPSEEDYDAISEAFMETARGRWFLGEYAKRNRNADTKMVLDAVERIEQSIAAQKQPEPAPEPVPDTSLADALTAIKAALGEARAAASVAVDDMALEAHLAPVRKGARVIREISWRWREIGADGRICDLLDSQVSAIEASCGGIAGADPHGALGVAFDLIGKCIAGFDDSEPAPEVAAEVMEAPAPSPLPPNELRAAVIAPETPAGSMSVETDAPVAGADAAHEMHVEAAAEEATRADDAMAVAAQPVEIADDAVATMTPEAAEAEDEALLDMIAAEMGAPDPSDEEEHFGVGPSAIAIAESAIQIAAMEAAEIEAAATQAVETARLAETRLAETRLAGTRLAETETAEMQSALSPSIEIATAMMAPFAQAPVAEAPAMLRTPLPIVEPSPPPPLRPSFEAAPAPLPQPAPEPSLGSTLIASGILGKPRNSASDPLAALRRLSQVEKIALFS